MGEGRNIKMPTAGDTAKTSHMFVDGNTGTSKT